MSHITRKMLISIFHYFMLENHDDEENIFFFVVKYVNESSECEKIDLFLHFVYP